MPFLSDTPPGSSRGIALPSGFDLNPEADEPNGNVLGAAFRRENVFGSSLNTFSYDENAPFDPSYRPWDDIQGTVYERYSERFVDARNAEQAASMKAQIDRELDDAHTLDAAGGWGFVAEMGAAILSPTSLLPGGAVVKAAKGGVRIGKTSMGVAAWSGTAAAIDEIILQSTQETRTTAESAAAIGGGVILGGLLGVGAGGLSHSAFKRSAAIAEELPEAITKFNEGLLDDLREVEGQNLSAASVNLDLTVRNEGRLKFLGKIPGFLRTDPLMRRQLSPLNESRRAVSRLAETVLQYEVNKDGLAPNAGNVESTVKSRRNTELAKTVGLLEKSYGEFVKDGPVGLLGRMTAPAVGRFGHLAGMPQKMSRAEFYQEVGKAMRRGDTHPIPQVQKAADTIRKEIFEKAKNDAIEVGLFDEGLGVKYADSYLTRVYNAEKITAHRNDGSENDIAPTLLRNMEQKQQAAIKRLENDDTVERTQSALNQARQEAREARKSLKKALKKTRAQRDRAQAGVKREKAVQRATDGLRKRFDRRRKALRQKTAKGYRPEASEAWRTHEVVTPQSDTPQAAGAIVDDLKARQSNAQKMLECVDGASVAACAVRYDLSANELAEIKTSIDQMGDPEIGIRAYLNGLEAQKTELQDILANDGVLVDLDGQVPDLSLYQNLQATIRSVRSALNNRPPDILQAVRGMGGFKVGSDNGELDVIFDTRAHTLKRKSGGLDPDYMREALAEAGYIPENTTEADLWDFLRRAADGEDVFSRQEWGADIEAYETAKAFADELEANGLDISSVKAEDILNLETSLAKDQKKAEIKAGEAGRSADKAGKATDSAGDRMLRVLERLEEADARLVELNEVAGPKVREEIKAARSEAVKLVGKLKDAKKARFTDEQLAEMSQYELNEIVEETIDAITGLKPGEHPFSATMAKPTRARVLDVEDIALEPWLESDIGVIASQYFNNIVPDIEITREFGDIEMSDVKRKITEEARRMTEKATSRKQRDRIAKEQREAIADLDGMRDRIRGRYGVPDNPRNIVTVGARTMRTLSYKGYLGGMAISAMPDVSGVIGRNGIEAAFGSIDAITDPARFKMALADAADLGAAAEWHLNSRAVSIAELTDEYGSATRFERGLGGAARVFSQATGMIGWNAGWKSVGGAFISSRLSKMAMKVLNGEAGEKDLIKLADNGIDQIMARRIATQIEKFGDMNGRLWLPQSAKWDDPVAAAAMRNAFNREIDLMIITPGQDKPLMFSTETGKFFSQFKSFTASAHHRILLSGIQRADAEVLAQVTTAIVLGAMVSRFKSYAGGYEQKSGVELWEDAIDRSGIGGWFFEAHGIANGLTGGALSISGEEVSRFGSRSKFEGLLGPSVDLSSNFYEGVAAAARGEMSTRDARNVLRPIPGNNLPYFMGLTNQISEAMSELR